MARLQNWCWTLKAALCNGHLDLHAVVRKFVDAGSCKTSSSRLRYIRHCEQNMLVPAKLDHAQCTTFTILERFCGVEIVLCCLATNFCTKCPATVAHKLHWRDELGSTSASLHATLIIMGKRLQHWWQWCDLLRKWKATFLCTADQNIEIVYRRGSENNFARKDIYFFLLMKTSQVISLLQVEEETGD